MHADNGKSPQRAGGETLIPMADDRLVARVGRHKNRDLSVRVEEADTGRVVNDLGSRRYDGDAALHQHLAAETQTTKTGRTSGRLVFGGGFGESKTLHGVSDEEYEREMESRS